jgi:hypothetical protein
MRKLSTRVAKQHGINQTHIIGLKTFYHAVLNFIFISDVVAHEYLLFSDEYSTRYWEIKAIIFKESTSMVKNKREEKKLEIPHNIKLN